MSVLWMSGNPAEPGWYPASLDMDETARRHWDGRKWSAPVYADDPREHWLRAQVMPASLEPGERMNFQYDTDVRDQVARWLARTSDVAACPDPFVGSQSVSAPSLLDAAAQHIRDRAAAYDKPEGERSMERTVQAFNAITGHGVSESEGWLFMELLKAVRDYTTEGGHADSQEDRIAYAALAAEARRAGK